MAFKVSRPSILCVATLLLTMQASLVIDAKEETTEDYCLYENFQPRCQQNEMIKMKSATYGRMRMGRCITVEEVETIGSRHLGCSVDVLPQLDRKCSRQTECNIRITDFAVENIKPCPAGLNVYLEATYDCVRVADEKRSCVVDVSTTPIHIMSSRTCGTKSQPWIVEAPVGQKITISLIAFPTSNSTKAQRKIQHPCQIYGAIVDKAGKQNVAICAAGNQRERKLYSSVGNVVEIFLNSSEQGITGDDGQVILSLQAIGCSDIIPPEDAYLKRSGDTAVIGCYTSRKTWHLTCEDGGNWIGVIGNCSQDTSVFESEPGLEPKETRLNNEQVLIILAVGGFTLAICLAIVCFGAVCLRRAHAKKMRQEYKTLNSNGIHSEGQGVLDPPGIDVHGMVHQQLPTYSVFVGDGEFNADIQHSAGFNSNINSSA